MEIYLTQGKIAIIDDEDFDLVSKHSWNPTSSSRNDTFYAKTNIRISPGKQSKILMHRLILGITDPKIHCDHINGNGLDNRRVNLRVCSVSENNRNVYKQKNNSSGYKGVVRYGEKYRAQIGVNKKSIYLGMFDDPESAYSAYCQAAIKYHGSFANIRKEKPE